MAKYTLELTIKYATELTLTELDEDTKEKLESSDDFDDEAYDVFYDSEYVAQGVVMNNDALYNADTFSLTVKDEDDNEIWSTTDVSQIKEYPELDENDEELPIQNFHYHPLEEGDYLVENNMMKWCTITYWLELKDGEEFDQSKLGFYPSSQFDYYLCEDDIHLTELAYDNHVIDDRTYEYNDNYSTDYKIIHFDGEYSDSYRED